MPLSETDIVRIQQEQAKTILFLHRVESDATGNEVCNPCLTPHPCRETEWALEVLSNTDMTPDAIPGG